MPRVLLPSAALLWGLQFAFLNPAIALLLVAVYGATTSQVGWALVAYNASGFVAALAVPVWADRRDDYLGPMLGCGILTVALAALLAATTSLPVAVIGLLVLGGPAGTGNSLLFSHLKRSGARPSDVVNTRAIVSFAWVAGPPLATVVMRGFGNRAVVVALAVVAVLNVLVTAQLRARARAGDTSRGAPGGTPGHEVDGGQRAISRPRLAAVLIVFILLQATNSAAVAVMSLFVTSMKLDVVWAGITLGVAAALEIPALLCIGWLARRAGELAILASGCVAGVVYYATTAHVENPIVLIGLQLPNAWFFATVAGVGLTMFQRLIPRPGLATGLYVNTRRLGAVVSGPMIALGAATSAGYGGVFTACAAVTAAALALLVLTGLRSEP